LKFALGKLFGKRKVVKKDCAVLVRKSFAGVSGWGPRTLEKCRPRREVCFLDEKKERKRVYYWKKNGFVVEERKVVK